MSFLGKIYCMSVSGEKNVLSLANWDIASYGAKGFLACGTFAVLVVQKGEGGHK